jgi:hypothetical protein
MQSLLRLVYWHTALQQESVVVQLLHLRGRVSYVRQTADNRFQEIGPCDEPP